MRLPGLYRAGSSIIFKMLQIQQYSDSGDSDPEENKQTHLKPLESGNTVSLLTSNICAAPHVTPIVSNRIA